MTSSAGRRGHLGDILRPQKMKWMLSDGHWFMCDLDGQGRTAGGFNDELVGRQIGRRRECVHQDERRRSS